LISDGEVYPSIALPADAFTAVLARRGLAVDGCQVTHLDGRWTRARGILVTAAVLVSG
jgi:hypothetical protein